MSGYPYGNPQYPPPQAPIYPTLYNQVNAAPPVGQPPAAYPVPGQQQYAFAPGFAYGVQPGQPGYPSAPPSAMSYPGAAQPTPAYGYPAGFPNVTPQPGPGQAVEWISTTSRNAHTLSDRAVVAGYEGHDGSPLWVIRSRFEGDLIPGKLAVKHCAAYVPWGGKENAVQSIEVCCARPEKVRWVECRDGNVPPNAVVGGHTSSGEQLYIGRARQEGSLTPGKVHPSHKAMYMSFAGKEIPHKFYEILCNV